MAKLNASLSRRKLLLGAAQGGGLLFLSGCEKFFNGLQQNKTFVSLLESAEGANQRVQRFLTGRNKLAREFTERDISRTFKANGNPPPITVDYMADAANQWNSWHLEISGLVEQPGTFSLVELKSMPARTQITRHDCVEGWSAIAKWRGVLPPSIRGEKVIAEILPRAEAGMTMRDMEKDLIRKTLARTDGNRTRAARILQIGVRTLQRKIKEYHLP